MGTSVGYIQSEKQSSTMKVFAAILGLVLVLNASNGVSAACTRADEAADLIKKEAGDADPDAICDAAKKCPWMRLWINWRDMLTNKVGVTGKSLRPPWTP